MKHDVMAFTTVLKHEATAPIVKVGEVGKGTGESDCAW
jgi:hypothetical protein